MIGKELKVYDGLSPIQQLNLYRNLYYNDGNATEHGIIANAINDILPVVRKSIGKEVIRALECCANGECDECPYQESSPCKEYLNNAALDLINRQRAEIDDLTRDTIPKLKYGLERANKYGVELEKSLANAKAEAIKEFAEMLKDRLIIIPTVYNSHYGRMIDNLVKELTESKPCTEDADCSTCEHCYRDGEYNECRTDGVK